MDVLSTTGDGKWHEISYDGTKGFVAGDYLKVTEEKLYGQVVVKPLNVALAPALTRRRWIPCLWEPSWRSRS